MSLTIKGATSGSVDVVAPASGSDVTLTLPTTTATVETTASSIASSRLTGALPALNGSALTGVGVDGIVSTANATTITIDSSENVGIGVTPDSTSTAYTSLHVGANAVIHGVTGSSANNDLLIGQNQYLDSSSNPKYQVTDEASQYYQGQGKHKFQVASSGTAGTAISWTTAMTIGITGNLNGGINSATTNHWQLSSSGGSLQLGGSVTTSNTRVDFRNPNGWVGAINTSGSSTSYNTTSDYRLKENLVPITDSIERVKSLKPYRFNFIADPTVTVDGFVAHEAGEIVPECCSGEKNAMKMEEYEITPAVLDDDGTETEPAVVGEREVIDPQGIDQSKLVPLLTAALQDAIKRIEILENA